MTSSWNCHFQPDRETFLVRLANTAIKQSCELLSTTLLPWHYRMTYTDERLGSPTKMNIVPRANLIHIPPVLIQTLCSAGLKSSLFFPLQMSPLSCRLCLRHLPKCFTYCLPRYLMPFNGTWNNVALSWFPWVKRNIISISKVFTNIN